jgi:hypothetical protein
MNDGAASAIHCRNCETALEPAQKFCGHCGQRTDLAPRLTLHEIGHDVLHALLHVDQSIFSLVRELLFRPGHVARDYIDGRRKRYFGPFAFLVITVGLASAMILVFGVDLFKPIGDNPVAHVLSRHVNLVVLLQLPILAACCWLFFVNEKLTFAEHLVFVAYVSGFRALILGVMLAPVIWATHSSPSAPGLVFAYYGIWALYLSFAATQFYRGNKGLTVVKVILAAAACQVITVGAIYFVAFHI